MPKKVYRTAIYCRLSREDGDKIESNSIASQRAICEDYIAKHDDLELVCEPFIDDGYSGVSFNRPHFKRLEEAIRKDTIDCIVVKDLSRFSRNYIDGGRYLEKIFPQLGIRFIAINDAYDSLTGDPQSDSFVIPFDGKIVCADCGKRMYFHRKRIDKDKRGRWYAFYECSTSVSRRYEHCTAHYTRQDKLEADVLAAIQLQVKAALDYDKLLDKLRGSEGEKNIRDKQNALITSLNLKLSGVSKKRTRLYEDFAEGLLDEEEYTFAKKSYDEQFADLSRRLNEAVQRRSKFNEAMSVDNKWITLMKSVSTATKLSQDLVDESVELVKVHAGGAVELVMKYGDIYALTVQSIKEVQEAM